MNGLYIEKEITIQGASKVPDTFVTQNSLIMYILKVKQGVERMPSWNHTLDDKLHFRRGLFHDNLPTSL
jgi:hypothetical protein